MFTRLIRSKKVLSAVALATGVGFVGYYVHNNIRIDYFDDYRSLVKTLQAKSTVITLANNTISKRYGPAITSTVPNDDFVDNLSPDIKSFSFTMNVRQGQKDDLYEDFGEVLVSVVKLDNMWHIDSIQIRFFNSNYPKWLKLYESMHLTRERGNHLLSSTVKLDDLLGSPALKDSDEYLKTFVKTHPFVLKSIELFLSDRDKLNGIGPPVRLLSHDIFESDVGYLLKMNIEGRRKNADLLVDVERAVSPSPSTKRVKDDSDEHTDWKITAMALMHEIKEDFILSNKDLADKYYKNLMKNIPGQEWDRIFSEINLTKLLEDKLIKHDRIMTTLGRPIQLSMNDSNENKITNDVANVKLFINGHLNNGELVLKAKKDADSKSWSLTSCEFKVLWDSSTNQV